MSSSASQAVVPPRPSAAPASPPLLDTLSRTEEALKASMMSPNFLDVKFYAFSRKYVMADGGIRVDRPQPVLAIGSVLKKIEDLDRLLSSGFSESSNRVDVNSGFPEDEKSYSDEYDYDSDSDLDEEDPIILELDDDMQDDVAQGSSHARRWNGKGRAAEPPRQPSQGNCTQIIVKDAAHHTWRAFIFYLYTGKVNFLQLKSQSEEERNLELVGALADPTAVPPCSPKSMYRLADKYGLTELQNRAFDAIKARLSTKNIVKEVFSKFTSRYDKIQALEIGFLTAHYGHNDVTDTLKQITDSIVQGDFPHASEVLKTLFELNLNPPPSRRTSQYVTTNGTSATFTGVGMSSPAVGNANVLLQPNPHRARGGRQAMRSLNPRPPASVASWQPNRPLPPLVSSASTASTARPSTNQLRWSTFMAPAHSGHDDDVMGDANSDDW